MAKPTSNFSKVRKEFKDFKREKNRGRNNRRRAVQAQKLSFLNG